ncbi:uncharacterized protein LOC142978614 [Anticarsia gemmatalis]|uniref:uncharacterized protein LOC142978614 n=1 Tax=Anticarsia gemmatalis TaxID=129554 RepID=UPI003F76542A
METTVLRLLMPLVVCMNVVYSDNLPKYIAAQSELEDAREALENNIVSMEGEIPSADDPRRHYTVILHVLQSQAFANVGCDESYYNEHYQHDIDALALEGAYKPQKTIEMTKQLIIDIKNKTDNIRALIRKECNNLLLEKCDPDIHREVTADPETYKTEAVVFFAAAKVASEINKKQLEFEQAAKDFAGRTYVWSEDKLKDAILALAYLNHLMGYTNKC